MEEKKDVQEEVKEEVKEEKASTKPKKEKKKCQCDENLKKIEELQNALLRMQADNINYRKRKDEEVERMLKYANEEIVKDILENIIDACDAVESANEGETYEAEDILKELKEQLNLE